MAAKLPKMMPLRQKKGPREMAERKRAHEAAAEIVRDAGGRIVGRTKLQKVGYLLQLAGFGDDFRFEYRHYGPYSEDLASAISTAEAFDLVTETERPNAWGGSYSIFELTRDAGEPEDGDRARFAAAAAEIGSLELELAATAAFLHVREHAADPWEETRRRKPEKAGNGRLDRAKQAYRTLRALPSRIPLPEIA